MTNVAQSATPKVYELKMQPGEAELWEIPETRQHVITGGIELAKDNGCRLLRVLDTEGKQLHLEGFGPRLWDLIDKAHRGIDAELQEVTDSAKQIHVHLQGTKEAFDCGDTVEAFRHIKAAMDLEYDTFGIVDHVGDDELLEALGYDIEKEES